MTKSKWDQKRSGSYEVNISGQMKHQNSYHEHHTYIEHAESPRDGYNKAKSGLNPNFNITKVIVVFLGCLILVALSQGWIVF